MKKAIITMVIMMAIMVFGVGPITSVFGALVGGGVEESYLYPIYAGIIILAGIIVGATDIIVSEIQELKELMKNEDGSEKL